MADEPKKPKRGSKGTKPVMGMVLEDAAAKSKKGGARPGAGRKPVQRSDVLGILSGLGFCPFTELVKLYREPDTTTKDRINIAQDLGGYVAPKLKQTDLKLQDGDSLMDSLIKHLADTGRPKPPTEG